MSNTVTILFVLVILSVALQSLSASKYVTEINKGMLQEYMKNKLFVVTYVDSTSCSRCRNLYPFFVAASEAFPDDEDIFFTRTYDKQLIQDWEIEELPALVYHKRDNDSPDAKPAQGVMTVDITVDDIVSSIEKILHGDFENVKRKYSVHLDSENFDEIVTTPSQSVLLLMYDKKTRKDTLLVFEKVAHAFRKEDAIVFASLDVAKHYSIRDSRFKTRDVPSIMWLGEKDKSTVKRFGGMISKELITTFINERTGLGRESNGALLREAGRILAVDDLLEEHADIVHHANPDTVALLVHAVQEKKPNMLDHQLPIIDYYAHVLNELAKGESTSDLLEEMVMNLQARFYDDEDYSTKTVELFKRQKNILHYFQRVVKTYRSGEWEKLMGSPDNRVDSKVTLEHSHHVHTEL